MRRCFVIVLLLLTLLSVNALALSWGEAVSLAEKNNNELIGAQKDLEASEWSYRRSFSTFLPQLSASAGWSNSQSSTSGAWSDSYSYGLSASQTLFQGMEGIYSIQAAYAGLEYQQASLRSARASLLYELRSAFLDLLIAQENIKLLAEILKQRQKNSQLIQLRYDSGKEDKGNLMTTRSDEKQAEHDLSSAKRDLRLAQLKLSQLLDQEVRSVEEPDAAAKPAVADFEKLLKGAPAYVTAQKQMEAAELSQKASISGFLPSLSLSGSYRKSGDDWPPDTASKSWSLSLSYALFPGGSNVADRAIEGARLDAAREDFARSVKDLRYSLEEAFQNYEDALEALEVSRISLAASQERAKITEVKYLNGLIGYDEWYRIENAYIQAQKSLLTSRKSALLTEAGWHKTYGGYVQ